MKITVTGLTSGECDFQVCDNSGVAFVGDAVIWTPVAEPTSYADLIAIAVPLLTAYCTAHSYSITTADFLFPETTDAHINALIAAALPVAPSSYQTIVSQTGTAAPAVSGSLAPVSTYPAGTTFTWARTGAGVYTLTASAAIFTAGKTGVFVGGLNNLNAQWKAVVTSTTVITLTFAVQSLAVLGLLGFTATNTDALLTGTLVEVRTYA